MKVHLWDLDEKGSLGDFPGIFEKKIESKPGSSFVRVTVRGQTTSSLPK